MSPFVLAVLLLTAPLVSAQGGLGCGFSWNAVNVDACEDGSLCSISTSECSAECVDDVGYSVVYTFSEQTGNNVGDAKDLAPLTIDGDSAWNTEELSGLRFGGDSGAHRASASSSSSSGSSLETDFWSSAVSLSGFTVEIWYTPSADSLESNDTSVITSLRPETDSTCLGRRFGIFQTGATLTLDVGPGLDSVTTEDVLEESAPTHIVYSRSELSFAVYINAVKVLENTTAELSYPALSSYSGPFNISVGSDLPENEFLEPLPNHCLGTPVDGMLYMVGFSAGASTLGKIEERFAEGHIHATVSNGVCGVVPLNVVLLTVYVLGITFGLMCCLGGMYVVLNNVKRDRAAARGDVTRSQFLGGGDIEVRDFNGGKKSKKDKKDKKKGGGGGGGYGGGGYGGRDDVQSTSTGGFSSGTGASFDDGYVGDDGWNPERQAASVGPGRLAAISMLPPDFDAGPSPLPPRKPSMKNAKKKSNKIVEDSDSSGSEGPLAAARMSGIAGANRAAKKKPDRAVNAISMLPPEDDGPKAISMFPPNMDAQSVAGSEFGADLGGYNPNPDRATILPPGFGGPAVSGPDRGNGGKGSRETTDGLRIEDYDPDEWGESITAEGVMPKPLGTTSGDEGFFKERPVSALPADPNRPISALPADPNKSRKKSRGRARGQSNQVEGSRGRRGSDHKHDKKRGGSDHMTDQRRRPSLGRKRSPSRENGGRNRSPGRDMQGGGGAKNDAYDLEFAIPAHLQHKLGKGSAQARGEFDLGGGGGGGYLGAHRRGTEQTGRSPRRGDRSPRRHTEHSPRRSPNRPSSLEFNLPASALQEAREVRKKKNKSPGRRR